jgi:cell division protein ZapA
VPLGVMATKPAGSTQVAIFGASYALRGGKDDEYLRELAAVVDRKMREVADHSGSGDAARTAILAALNLADELLQHREQQSGERIEVKQRVARLAGTLGDALRTESAV